MSEKKIPAIRFKGFTNGWNRRKLGDIGETFNGLSGKSKVDFGHGKGQFVTYMNVFLNAISDLNMLGQTEIDSKQDAVKYGDIFFTTSSETPDEVGMSSVWLGNKENIYLNSFCFGYRPFEQLNPYYMAFMLRSDIIREKIIYLAQGISRYNISKKGMMEIEVPIPSLTEQGKIGEYLNKIDHIINIHQRKLTKLQLLKKSMLTKMFPKDGARVPEIRFQGFHDDWEYRKIFDIAPLQRGFDLPTAKMSPGKYPVVMSNGIGGYHSEYKVKGPGVITGRSGTIGKLHYTDNNYWPHNTTLWVTDFKENFPKFIYYLYDWLDLSRFEAGSGVPTLNRNDVHNTKVAIPIVYDEQKKIATYLDDLDNFITLHQNKLSKLQKIKQAMLSKLFV